MTSGALSFCFSRQAVFYTSFDVFNIFYNEHISLPCSPPLSFLSCSPRPLLFSFSEPHSVHRHSESHEVSPCGLPDSDTRRLRFAASRSLRSPLFWLRWPESVLVTRPMRLTAPSDDITILKPLPNVFRERYPQLSPGKTALARRRPWAETSRRLPSSTTSKLPASIHYSSIACAKKSYTQ